MASGTNRRTHLAKRKDGFFEARCLGQTDGLGISERCVYMICDILLMLLAALCEGVTVCKFTYIRRRVADTIQAEIVYGFYFGGVAYLL